MHENLALRSLGQGLDHPDGSIFKREDGSEKPKCSWQGESNGLGGTDWWYELPPEYVSWWKNIRLVAIRVLSQTSTESAAERRFSAVEVVQPKFRATLGIRSVQKRAFVRAQINSEIADYAAATAARLRRFGRVQCSWRFGGHTRGARVLRLIS